MKTKKPLIVRIFIWICVFAMVISLIWVYVVYMFAPTQEPVEDINNEEQQIENIENEENIEEIAEDNTGENIDENIDENTELDTNEENVENPENEDNFNLVTEDWEINEMAQTTEVQLENWETELVRLGDLWDSIEIN